MNTSRVSGTLTPPMVEDLEKLLEKGYGQAEIVRGGVRMFIEKKKAEGEIPA